MKIAFVNQPIDKILPPNQNSVGACTFGAARSLAKLCDVVAYGMSDKQDVDFGSQLALSFCVIDTKRPLDRESSAQIFKTCPDFSPILFRLGNFLTLAVGWPSHSSTNNATSFTFNIVQRIYPLFVHTIPAPKSCCTSTPSGFLNTNLHGCKVGYATST